MCILVALSLWPQLELELGGGSEALSLAENQIEVKRFMLASR